MNDKKEPVLEYTLKQALLSIIGGDKMHSINPKDKTERENYKILTGSIIPRPIAFVTTLTADGMVNGAPFSYFNIVSSNPPLLSLAIQRKAGGKKDTVRNILQQKEFVIQVVGMDNVNQVNKTAASLPADESEVSLAKMNLVNSEQIKVPGVKEAKVRFECVLEKHIPLGEADNTSTDLIIGKVLRYHLDETVYDKEKDYIHMEALDAVSRLAGNNYAKQGDVFTLQRPK